MSALDVRYGRQGGRRTCHRPFRITGTCDVCGGTMVLGQPGRHWSCAPKCMGCRRPLGPHGENCHCSTADQRRQRAAMQGDRT